MLGLALDAVNEVRGKAGETVCTFGRAPTVTATVMVVITEISAGMITSQMAKSVVVWLIVVKELFPASPGGMEMLAGGILLNARIAGHFALPSKWRHGDLCPVTPGVLP